MLPDYQAKFLGLVVDMGALKIGGEYKLKSGRISPYFFNAGLFNTGKSLLQLGEAFADAIHASGVKFDMLFGPAYKGIPLVSAVSIAFYSKYGLEIPFAFNRKEVKDHGEGGVIVGSSLKGRVLLIDDVITAGTAIRESMDLLRSFPECSVAGVAVALDRQEKAPGSDESAIQSVEREYAIPVISITNLNSILTYSQGKYSSAVIDALSKYRQEYGV